MEEIRNVTFIFMANMKLVIKINMIYERMKYRVMCLFVF